MKQPWTSRAGMALLVLLPTLLGGVAASSDGWTPIIPEGGRHAPVEPVLGSSLSSLASSIGASSYHSHVDHHVDHHVGHSAGHHVGHAHVYRPPRPSHVHVSLPSPLPSSIPDYPLHSSDHGDTCALYKAAMTQDLYFQYIQYKVHMPDLKEFTLCMWHKFYNHSSDHPLFSYAIRDTPRAILSWVTATDRSTYFSMSVDGHKLYRLNYPLRLNRWYHSCQSWSGRTGEWQVWVNAERVGRGFHNLLVNHVIKGGGVAITGQEQRQYCGGFLEGEGAPKGAGGMLGEITQLQMYSVALTAGKAYRDHKHHHGNYNSPSEAGQRSTSTTTTPAPMPETSTINPYAPFITNGQLTPQLPIFELSAFRKNIPMMDDAQAGQTSQAASTGAMLELSQLLAGSGSPAVSYLHMTPTAGGAAVRIPLLTHTRPVELDPQQHYLFKRDDSADKETRRDEAGDGKPTASTKVKRAADPEAAAAAKEEEETAAEKAAANVEPLKLAAGKHGKRSKLRKTPASTAAAPSSVPDPAAEAGVDVKPSSQTKRELDPAEEAAEAAETKKKRQTISLHGGPVDLGGDIDTSLLSQGLSGLLPHGELLGGAGGHPGPSPVAYIEYHGNHNHQQLLSAPAGGKVSASAGPPAPPLKRENEPAEGEVMAVMAMCSGCAPDPFAKVNIISWQGTPKKLYSGVLYQPAKPVCRKF